MDFNAALNEDCNKESFNLDDTREAEQPGEDYPVTKNPLDLFSVQAKFNQHLEAIGTMKVEAIKLEVIDDQSNELAVEMAGQSKKLMNQIEKMRKDIVEEPKKFTSAVDGFAKKFKDQLSEIERALKFKIGKYLNQKELARIEAERKAKQEQEKLQKQINKEAKKAGIDPVEVPQMVIPEAKTITRTDDGTASIKKEWTYEVEDITLVPREYMILDEKKVRGAVKAGMRTIPGLKIYQETNVAIRTK